ncbi:hypothetical protein [Sphingobium sp.]|uniref:hypothetical protein n=1 Tax=Sphingobium sp. TaxID=1912891 RepID=UPI003BB742CD
MAKQRLRGIGRVRRLIRRLPVEMRGELIVELRVTGRRIWQAIKARTPRNTGALEGGISYRVLPTSLRLQIGLLGTPRGRARLFYGRIQDLGRREQVVLVQRRRRVAVSTGSGTTAAILRTSRGRKVPGDIVSTYRMKVRGMEGKRFVTGRYPDLRRELRDNLTGILARVLLKIGGAGE